MKRPLIAIAALAAAGLFGTGLVVGGITGIPGTSAATAVTAPQTATRALQPNAGPPPASFPAHGTPAHENAEKAVTGSAAAKAQSAAVKSVGSGTAGPVTSDFQGTGYEVTVTKSDGTKVDVRLDSSFNVQAGPGGPGGPGGQ